VKQVPGRKSDASDAEWLAELLQYGLVRGSFIPPEPVRELRELTRMRVSLIEEKTEHGNRIQKVLETANIKLGSVASDVLGVSGRRMLKALCEGVQEPRQLAELACGTLRNKLPELERALTGRVTEHHRFLLSLELEMVTLLERKIEQVEERIERVMQTEAPGDGEGAPSRPFAAAAQLLKTIPGVSDCGARAVLGELGTNVAQFPSHLHLASWAGLAPGMNTSGERRKPARVKKGNTKLKRALVQCAWAGVRKKDSYFHALFCRITRKHGKQVAIVAVAHSMIVSIYHMLKTGEVYRELGTAHFGQQDRERAKRSMIKRLEALGYVVSVVAKAS
jgi:transposase